MPCFMPPIGLRHDTACKAAEDADVRVRTHPRS
jgi:hypothetical protein